MDDNLDRIYASLKHWTDGTKEITSAGLTILVLEVIQLVEKVKINGAAKKQLALDLVEKLIRESSIEDKENFLMIAKAIVPSMIDSIIDIDKRKITIKTQKKIRSCMGDLGCI
jgi:hypothetical protein